MWKDDRVGAVIVYFWFPEVGGQIEVNLHARADDSVEGSRIFCNVSSSSLDAAVDHAYQDYKNYIAAL